MKLPSDLRLARRFAALLAVGLALTMAVNPYLHLISDPLPWRFLIELVCVVLYFSVFIVSWNAYEIHRKSRSVILALGFLCVAIFNFFHLAGTFSLISSPGYQQTTLLFTLLWKLTAALILLLVGFEKKSGELSRLQSGWLLELALTIVAALSFLVFFYFDQIPPLNHSGSWPFQLKSTIEVILIGLMLMASGLFYRQAKTLSQVDERKEQTWLFLASFILAMSEFCDLRNNNDLLGITGQLFQFIAALCVYLSIVTVSLRAPFLQLAQARKEISKNRTRLNGIIQTASDGIITINAAHIVILVNPAAETYFGYEPGQMLGLNLDLLIPKNHRGGHAQHVDQFGKTGVSIRQMGMQYPDFSVNGLKKNGEQFPIEASISSLLEDGERFYTVIFRDISDRKIAKQKLEQYHRELSNLSHSLQTVREEERKHIARELHDDLGQLLAALRMDLSLLEKRQSDNIKTQPIISSMDKLLLNSISTLRRIASDLRPRALDEGGLYFALLTLQKEFIQRHQIACELNAVETELILNDGLSTTIFRVIQESLTNVVRHAHATQVWITLSQTDGKLSFSIQDNGKGIAEQDFVKHQSFGLVGMRERVRALQGELTITGNEHGTCIEVALPITSEAPQP